MTINIKDGGSWKEVKGLYVKDGGVWKEVKEGYVKEGGVWKQTYKPGPEYEYRYEFDLYAAAGGSGWFAPGGKGGAVSVTFYSLSGKGSPSFRIVIASPVSSGINAKRSFGAGNGGLAADPDLVRKHWAGMGGGGSAIYVGGTLVAVCGGGGGGGGGDRTSGYGGDGASPNSEATNGDAGGNHDGSLGPGTPGGQGGLFVFPGNDGGGNGCNSPGGGSGGGGLTAQGSAPLDCNTTRCGGAGGGGGGLLTLDGNVGGYRMVYTGNPNKTGQGGYLRILPRRRLGEQGQWEQFAPEVTVRPGEDQPGDIVFDPSTLPG